MPKIIERDFKKTPMTTKEMGELCEKALRESDSKRIDRLRFREMCNRRGQLRLFDFIDEKILYWHQFIPCGNYRWKAHAT